MSGGVSRFDDGHVFDGDGNPITAALNVKLETVDGRPSLVARPTDFHARSAGVEVNAADDVAVSIPLDTIRNLLDADRERLKLSPEAQAIVAGFLDPNTPTDEILAPDAVWAEVRAMFPPIVYRRALDDEDQIGGEPRDDAGGVSDTAALDQLAAFMWPTGDPHSDDCPGGAAVAEFAGRVLGATGRAAGHQPGEFTVGGEVR